MNIWEIDKVLLFLVLFIPGFISLKVYDLIIAGDKRDFSKSISEVVGYSALNFAALWWLVSLATQEQLSESCPFLYWLYLSLVFLIFPAIWPVVFYKLSQLEIFKRHLLSPIKQPWDFVFSQRKSHWVVVHMKNGNTIRGKYAKNSSTSAYPSERQIYLEEVWKKSEKGGFKEKVKRTNGVIIFESEISYIELYK